MTLAKGIALGNMLSADGSSIAFSSAQLDNVVGLGAKSVRLEVRLGSAHPTWDDTIVDLYSQVVSQLAGAGLRVIGLLDSTLVSGSTQADWNTGNTENTPGASATNPFIDAYVRAAARVVSALPQVTTWEIWNEPNAYSTRSGTVYTGSSYIYPSIYATLLARVYPLLKAIDPSCTVLTGGLFGHDIGGVASSTNSGADYLRAVFAQLSQRGVGKRGIRWPFDAAGQHLYLDQGGPLASGHITTYLGYLSNIMAGYLTGTTRIIVTEIGWKLSANVTADLQAQNLTAAYLEMTQVQALTDACWFALDDSTNPTWGLYANPLTIKPSGTAYQLVAA